MLTKELIEQKVEIHQGLYDQYSALANAEMGAVLALRELLALDLATPPEDATPC
jgi:hypothetical protein